MSEQSRLVSPKQLQRVIVMFALQPSPVEMCGVRCWRDEDCSASLVCEEGNCVSNVPCISNQNCKDACVNGMFSEFRQ